MRMYQSLPLTDRLAAACTAAVVGVSGVLIALPAQAAPAATEVADARVVTFDRAELRAVTRAVSGVGGSGRTDSVDDSLRQRVKEHIEDAVRAGRLVDERRLMSASIADPYNRGRRINMIWDGEKGPDRVTYASMGESPESGMAAALGVQWGGEDAAEAPMTKSARVTGGSGYGAGFNVTGMRNADSNCATTWFTSGWNSSRDHKIVSCYEDWEQDGTVHYVYNRWALWTPAPAPWPYTTTTKDFYVAARAWSGHEYKFARLRDWAPRSGDLISSCDSSRNFTLGGSYGGVSASVSIPINVCQNYWMDITTTSPWKIGIDFDGSRSGQMYMDVAGRYEAINSSVQLVWADYNWVTVNACGVTNCPTQHWVAKDSGW
ncbi:hypothetical protein O7608_08970 [Solwaraspora sp. WMMA2056]|uniref:hypothetical protein n=1 Tax=Solwaraspora sp. WMMA2056 TaxID=3015161 RepID=UPI00259B4619|nr:hypothetical protein [Solwaraspora sp. WMMA2056]WJK42487.1 hypothetical protein O7608_08970 [Solwaraspora sp. WMMA2056]